MKTIIGCVEKDCSGKHYGRGLCYNHYMGRFRRKEAMPLQAQGASEEDSFWSYVEKTDGCWAWTGYIDEKGYGRFNQLQPNGGRKARPAHRVAYTFTHKQIPPNLTVDHLCRTRHCVNPSHLEPVTNKENILRGEGLAAQNAKKTHCLRGHPFDESNTYKKPRGGRQCRTCKPLHYALRKV